MSENDHTKCKELLGFLSEYVDGSLSEDLCQEIEAHAENCDNCRIVVDTLRKTVSLYNGISDEHSEIPTHVRERLFRTLNLEDYLNQ
jgi:anti-sigma factor RsiW